jgi:tetratricopeptide (TPR) repeat protein
MVRRMCTTADAGTFLPPTVGFVTERGAVPSTPTQFGRFEVRRELGRGAFGVVYLAYDPRLRRDVALKLPRAEAFMTPELRARFRQEAQAAAGLDHPNIVPVYDAGEEGPGCFIASAYCPSVTLAAWLRERTTPVAPRVAADLVATLADAVEHAHQRGVLHRDLKPSNVLLERSADHVPADDAGRLVPRITDFGLAKLMDMDTASPEAATLSGAILGTPSYMAPEQAGSQAAVGRAADVYGLGAILYEVLTGRPPFQGDSTLETLLLVRTQDPLPPSRLRPRLPRDLETICLKCLHKQPASRYVSAAALADDLRRFLAAEPIVARPTPAWERAAKWVRRRPAIAALLATTAFAVIALGAVIGLANIRLKRERDRAEARRLEAVANLGKAREAVDRMLTRVSEDRLKGLPQAEPVQRALLQDALEFYRDLARQAHKDPRILHETARAYGRVGGTYHWLGRLDDAQRCYQEALKIEDELVARYPTEVPYRKEVGATHLAFGRLARDRGKVPEAMRELEKALRLLEESVASNPRDPAARKDLASGYNVLAMVEETETRPRDAEANYRKSIELLDALTSEYPAAMHYPTFACVARNNLACLLEATGKLDQAEEIHNRNRATLQGFVAREPSSIEYRSKLALTLENLSAVLAKKGRPREAEEAMREVVKLQTELVKHLPNTPFYANQLGDVLARLAGFVAERGDLGEAQRLGMDAVRHRREALALEPKAGVVLDSLLGPVPGLVETLLRLRDYTTAALLIQEAAPLCAKSGRDCHRASSLLARCITLAEVDSSLTEPQRAALTKRYGDQAMDLLRTAHDLAYRNIDQLKTDASFDPLRTRPDFLALLIGSVSNAAAHRPQ